MTTHHQAEVKEPVQSLAARVLSLLRRPDQPFLRYINADLHAEELSFRDFFLHAMITSSLYDLFQVPVGGTVILVLSNPKDVFLAEAGALLTGRIPIVSAHPSPKLSISDFGRTLLPLIDNAAPSLIVGDPAYCAYLSSSIGRRVASFDDIQAPHKLPQVIASDNPALFIQYSSGTTGTKKGVTISQQQLLWQVDAYAKAIGLTAQDHIVSWLPYYHDMGLITSLLMPLLTGTPITVMSPFDWVKNPLMLLKAITKYRGTLTWLPNFSYNFLAQAAQRGGTSAFDLSSLRGVVNCSEPVSAASHEIFLKTFSGCGFRADALAASYAMAETTFAVTSGGFGHPLRTDTIDRGALQIGGAVRSGAHEIVSSGRALGDTDVVILGSEGAQMAERHIGEIAVRSPSLMGGYFKNAEATKTAYAGDFFRTGDLGYLDGGELYVTGRIKDLIIAAGRNIYPQDIEAIVNDLPETADGRCVAFGITDDAKGTEQVVILAELSPTTDISARKAAQVIAKAVTERFDVNIGEVLVVDAGWLKKSTSGKMARGQNREKYLELKSAVVGPRAIDPKSTEDRVRQCIYKAAGAWVENEDEPLITAGTVDSLALSNLLFELEDAFKKTLPTPEEIGFNVYDNIRAITALVSGDRITPAVQESPLTELVIDRQVKANYVAEGSRDFDTLILGSSRSYLIRAGRAAEHQLKAFQFTVAGARIEEMYSMVRYFLHMNKTSLKHIIIGTDPIQFSPILPVDCRFVRSKSLFAFLDDEDRAGKAGLNLEDINAEARVGEFSRRTRIYYNAWDLDLAFNPKNGDVIKLFGKRIAELMTLTYSASETHVKWPGQFLIAKDLTHFHPRRLHYLDKLMRITADIGCKVSFYTNPLHPSMIELLKAQTPYLETQAALVELLRKAGHDGVSVHAFTIPSDFGGMNDDFYDGVHMGRTNGDILLDYVINAGKRSKT